MKRRILILSGVVVLVAAAWIPSILHNARQNSERTQAVRALQSLPRERINTAVDAFARDRRSAGAPVPEYVSIQQLASGGYLSSNEVAAFRGMDVAFAVEPVKSDPNAILARVRLTDGRELIEVADGGGIQRIK